MSHSIMRTERREWAETLARALSSVGAQIETSEAVYDYGSSTDRCDVDWRTSRTVTEYRVTVPTEGMAKKIRAARKGSKPDKMSSQEAIDRHNLHVILEAAK